MNRGDVVEGDIPRILRHFSLVPAAFRGVRERNPLRAGKIRPAPWGDFSSPANAPRDTGHAPTRTHRPDSPRPPTRPLPHPRPPRTPQARPAPPPPYPGLPPR